MNRYLQVAGIWFRFDSHSKHFLKIGLGSVLFRETGDIFLNLSDGILDIYVQMQKAKGRILRQEIALF